MSNGKTNGPNGNRGYGNISSAELKCGTVHAVSGTSAILIE